MELQAALLGLLISLSQGQFFSPPFALSPIPLQLGFPRGFTSQSLGLPMFSSPPPQTSKKSNAGTYSPFAPPNDPAANPMITNLLTSSRDMIIAGKKAQEVKALFDQGSFRSFNLEMSTQNVAIISADPTKELRVHCHVTTDYNTPQAKTFSDFAVGCGYKGSVGSLRVCLDENHRDNKICRKLSLRVDARAFEVKKDNKTAPLIHGMRSLLFAGMPVDLSMMSERTAFSLMGSLGMIVPMATHAKVFLNGKFLGVYSFVQAVDEEFTQVHFANDKRKGKGGLYKELWFNPLHMLNPSDNFQSGAKSDEKFMRDIMAAVERTPLTGDAPKQFFDQYFDVQSFIDLTAFNTVIGATDDWRQRHNFYLYVREDNFGKKLVWIPWDYDRLYDEGSDTRGALKGKPWWDISATATPAACNQLSKSSQEQAVALGGTPARIAWNKDIFDQFPPDINVPVTCDKLTKLMAAALAPRIRQRTREIAGQINMNQIRSLWSTWNAQIQTALERDPSGPPIAIMTAQQRQLEQHLTRSLQKAVSEANAADGSSSSSWSPAQTGASLPSFAPKSLSLTPSFTPSFSAFTPSFQTPSFQSPSFQTPFQTPSFQTFQTPFQTPSFQSSFQSPSFQSFVPRTTSFIG
jgi:hypothetical protein